LLWFSCGYSSNNKPLWFAKVCEANRSKPGKKKQNLINYEDKITVLWYSVATWLKRSCLRTPSSW
jgi:hypothetical protein